MTTRTFTGDLYCPRCQAYHRVAAEVRLRSGRRVAWARCPTCSGRMQRLLAKA